jgi:hypothetical protein
MQKTITLMIQKNDALMQKDYFLLDNHYPCI